METITIDTPAGSQALQAMPVIKAENAFKPDMHDFSFALAAFALGYLFSRWVLFTWQGWGVTAFTTVYLLSVTAYLIKKGVFIKNCAAWFWMAVTLAAGFSYALWENASLAFIRASFLFCAAVYFVLAASGRTVMGATSNYLLADGLNATIIIPFRNIINQYVSFSALRKGESKRKKALPVILGIFLAVLCFLGIIPLLMRADSGGFGIIMGFFNDILRRIISAELIFYGLFALPAAAYLYGLVSGAAHRKGTDIIKPEEVKKAAAGARVLQPATVFIVLGAVCGLYLIFIFSQTPYFFSAFTGRRPEGWLVYAQYARQWFFELCGIAAVNLVIITASNVTCRKSRAESRPLKAFNISLAVITLVLIATAFSKMAMYIGVYGLTMPRLLPCVFMVITAAVFVALIALQKWSFSIVRFALITGSVMLCVLFLSNPDALVVRYNTDRYLAGTLQDYDIEILYRSGSAGVRPAAEVYEKTDDEILKVSIFRYLQYQNGRYYGQSYAHRGSFETQRAGQWLPSPQAPSSP